MMTEPAFDEEKVASLLASLEPHLQLAFGAASCERLLPSYLTFSKEEAWGDPGKLREALDVVWESCGGGGLVEPEIRRLLAECERQVPDSQEFDSLYVSAAQDAVFAVCSLLDFLLDEDPLRIVNSARYPTDSIDLIVQETDDMNPQNTALEVKIVGHPLMQQELMRQARDLAWLQDVQERVGSDGNRLRAVVEGEEVLRLAEVKHECEVRNDKEIGH